MSENKAGPPTGLPERRASTRVRLPEPLSSQLSLDLDSDVLLLSSGGMMIRLPFPLDAGSGHGFTLGVEQELIDVGGVVRNCERVDDGPVPFYRIGIEFQGLDDRQRAFLERFVERKLQP